MFSTFKSIFLGIMFFLRCAGVYDVLRVYFTNLHEIFFFMFLDNFERYIDPTVLQNIVSFFLLWNIAENRAKIRNFRKNGSHFLNKQCIKNRMDQYLEDTKTNKNWVHFIILDHHEGRNRAHRMSITFLEDWSNGQLRYVQNY